MDEFMEGVGMASAAWLFILLVALAFTNTCTMDQQRARAIGNKAAKYVITNPATGATEFRWNDELTTGGVTR